ncbi:hypothetical protein [Neotamlana laminarinivorans]|uniref:Uncharacterized protein n=1 Tax=Neotamlana laminarinivorans TaxID=2883124 RepID=A0A9X1L4B1_9FLAO|nr:hypothetical protein [Tamlana laminarinivorans]MCB4798146.1 hypothetical protein [Tamlana laminarinivorans]
MKKKSIVIFFSIVLLGFISAPTIIIAIDSSVDISMFYSIAEEEEEVSKITLQNQNFDSEPAYLKPLYSFNHIEYYCKNYPKPHLNLISPPPEISIV